jgi:hypothetical protein
MKTVLVLAIIAAVCMCSGDESLPCEYDEPATSTPDQWSQDELREYRNFVARLEEGGERELQKIVERASKHKSASESFRRTLADDPGHKFTPQERHFFQLYFCGILGLDERLVGHDVVKTAYQRFSCFNFWRLGENKPEEVQELLNMMEEIRMTVMEWFYNDEKRWDHYQIPSRTRVKRAVRTAM